MTMINNDEIIQIWISQLLDVNGVPEVNALTQEMIEKEITETEYSIKNEELWALGSSGKTSSMHTNNAMVMREYIKHLKGLMPPMHDLELVLRIYDDPDEFPERVSFHVPERVTMTELRRLLVEVRDHSEPKDCVEEAFDSIMDEVCVNIGGNSYWRKSQMKDLLKIENLWVMKA